MGERASLVPNFQIGNEGKPRTISSARTILLVLRQGVASRIPL